MNKYPMTVHGFNVLTKELKHLKYCIRAQLSQAIAEARALGDLKENAEYNAAREQQGLVEARIRSIEVKLYNAQIIDIKTIPNVGIVIFGSTVEIVNINTNNNSTYKIVGDDEADIKKMKISINSPLARFLISKKEGDITLVETPNGPVEYKILKVNHI